MDSNTYVQQWITWFEQAIRLLEKRQQELELENKRLSERLEAIKPVQFGNITYKIQELNVNELKGTLNIGLTSLADDNQIQSIIDQMKISQDTDMEHP